VLLAGTALAGTTQSHTVETEMKNLTPIIVVEAIEPCLPFWTERLGFEVIATVPHDGVTGFAMLKNGGVDVMYQSRASVDADLGASGGPADLGAQLEAGKSTLFIEVDAIDPLLDKLAGVDVVVPRRTTFYGMDEVFVQAPCGTLVGFAAKVGQG
jgi:uncharacterized glyoxalase superfamily protein PhnB